MTIAILPARLANQIAAGEVVERPASVIKELVENALDAGATSIHIDVDKGGIKKIRLSDNGCGIAKDQLTLALSRHATSKIKDLSDLEAIDSLGFRGEALASISSVSRLTLTSKPKDQDTAWQANAQGRDMAVTIKPAAHPDGTSIEVLDLFFNTPARRKFLRTEKTEFNHIDEVIRRIALACFEVTFSLTHNGKMVRQYRAATTPEQQAKRVAMVCGQKFIEHAITVDCQHDDIHFFGWLASPSFARNQNDLCYSYVNGRMMRDKLINHAIRQAYADLLPTDTYPAFVLFLTLNHCEVDVNVHPAKHEVRFHQSRYVHDFIYSVCQQALTNDAPVVTQSAEHLSAHEQLSAENTSSVMYQRPDYVTPLQQVRDSDVVSQASYATYGATRREKSDYSTPLAMKNYQQLLTPANVSRQIEPLNGTVSSLSKEDFFLAIEQGKYGIFKREKCLYLMPLLALAHDVQKIVISKSWQQGEQGLVSQPLLLPLMLTLTKPQIQLVQAQQPLLQQAGIILELSNKDRVQIRQYPALLRDNDVQSSFIALLEACQQFSGASQQLISDERFIHVLARVVANTSYSEEQANKLWLAAKKYLNDELIQSHLLNCAALDLRSQIIQLESVTAN